MQPSVAVGSTNRTKIKAVQTVFPASDVLPVDTASNVSPQPVGDVETKTGAENRAIAARNETEATIGIGLEGGIDTIDNQLYLCNWGVLVTEDEEMFCASGARIQLPLSFQEPLLNRTELSTLMNKYQNRTDIRHWEGAVGVFSNGELDRSEMFGQVVQLLKGQMSYWHAR